MKVHQLNIPHIEVELAARFVKEENSIKSSKGIFALRQ